MLSLLPVHRISVFLELHPLPQWSCVDIEWRQIRWKWLVVVLRGFLISFPLKPIPTFVIFPRGFFMKRLCDDSTCSWSMNQLCTVPKIIWSSIKNNLRRSDFCICGTTRGHRHHCGNPLTYELLFLIQIQVLLEYSKHCATNNLNLRIKTELVTTGQHAIVQNISDCCLSFICMVHTVYLA